MNIFYPLEIFSDWLVYSLFGLQAGTHWSEVLVFFVNDTLKILLLLIVITHVMSLVRHYLPINKFKNFLTTHKLFGLDYVVASGFGAITPFCSCSSIPLFIGFTQGGIPLGVAFSFLITSPLINEVAIALFLSIFGWKITVLYVVAGMLVGVVGGFVLQRFKMDKYIISLEAKKPCGCGCKKETPTKKQIANKIIKEAWGIVLQVLPYIIIGVGVGAVIHGFVPTGFFESYLETAGIFGVPLAVILAVPLYSNASGVIPIIEALVAKGVPMGTALAFMMATVGLSLPEAMILKKVMKLKLLLTFFGIVTVGIILIGYLFNIVL